MGFASRSVVAMVYSCCIPYLVPDSSCGTVVMLIILHRSEFGKFGVNSKVRGQWPFRFGGFLKFWHFPWSRHWSSQIGYLGEDFPTKSILDHFLVILLLQPEHIC